jgi:5-methylcytosine-specific restriction endonuclease McrA
MSTPPTPEFQLVFLQKVQRVLDEGQFVATYKFALLHALADLAVLHGDDAGGELRLSTRAIAERFVELYWRQAIPYPSGESLAVLNQNTGRQAAIVKRIAQSRLEHGDSLFGLKCDPREWRRLVGAVEQTMKAQPLWRLQTVGRESLDFLYPDQGQGSEITLRSGISYCLRMFHGLVTSLCSTAWIRHIRKCNESMLGDRADLAEFMFGAERNDLSRHRAILLEVQRGGCFYCNGSIPDAGEVDHFIPWSMYPADLGHNFVLAHKTCNGQKSDHLAAYNHLEKWCERNESDGSTLAEMFDEHRVVHDVANSQRIACWAYARLEAVEGQTWVKGRRALVPLASRWRTLPGLRSMPGGY